MIPALLIWLYNKYASNASKRRLKALQSGKCPKTASQFLTIILILASVSSAVADQEKTATYRVLHNGKVIGKAIFQVRAQGGETFLRMSSEVNTRLLFNIQVNTIDEARYKGGQLVLSSVCRKVNGKEKEAKRTTFLQGSYQLQSGDKTRIWKTPIRYNMLQIYCHEPIDRSTIYSDNFQQILSIGKISEHVYRINMPDGGQNTYHFMNGICRLVEVRHTLYTIKMELI